MHIGNRSLLAGALGALIGMQLACAHAPAQSEGKSTAAVSDKVFVTGSHIPVHVDAKTGMPVTISPVRIYSRDQLLGTGRESNLRAAIGTLDPSVGP